LQSAIEKNPFEIFQMAGTWKHIQEPHIPDRRLSTGVLGVHTALLPIGKAGSILYYAGNTWTEPQMWEKAAMNDYPPTDSNYLAGYKQISNTCLFNCLTNTISNPQSPHADLFRSGHAFLRDGRLVIAGGTQFQDTDDDAQHGDLLHHDPATNTTTPPLRMNSVARLLSTE
jgi:hypothetical protein